MPRQKDRNKTHRTMKEEDIIRQHDTGRNPFAVPEGYFRDFDERLMQRLAELSDGVATESGGAAASSGPRGKVVVMPVRRWMRYAAAIAVAALCIGGGTYLYNRGTAAEPEADAAELLLSDDNIDEILDYEMLNNNQIAYYLTEAY